MKLFIKIILLITILIAIYLDIPRSGSKLLYFPEKNYIEALELQDTPISTYDFKILKLLGAKSGWIRLENSDNSLWSIYKKALDKKREKSRKIVVFGGDILSNILHTIAKQTNLDYNKLVKKYLEISNYNEGEILARTYYVPYKVSEDSVISYLLYKSHEIARNILKNRDVLVPSNDYKNYLTIASLIEKETQYYPEMPLISAVIHNRLKKGMKLQLDASLNYGKNAHKIVTHDLITQDSSRYNTYKHKGLPPSAICSPSVVALKAAVNPANVDYLYFVKSGKRHTFSKNYREHIVEVREYKSKLAKKTAKKVNNMLMKKIEYNLPQVRPNLKINLPIK